MEEKPNGLLTRRPERRSQPRYAVDDRATLLLLNHGLNVAGQIVELSLGGCRLRVPRESRMSFAGRVEITFKVKGIAFRLSGVLRWTDGHQVVGIRFGEITSRRRDELSELLAEIEAEVAANAAKDEADRLDAEAMEAESQAAQQLNANKLAEAAEQTKLVAENRFQMRLAQEKLTRAKLAEARLAEEREAQRRLAEQVAAARARMQAATIARAETQRSIAPLIASQAANLAPATPIEVENLNLQSVPVKAASPAKRERRAQTRNSVDSQATIFLVDVMSRATGRIVDVSLGGCRIRTNERFPVGIYRRVEVEFVLDGLPFRLGGVTQSLHDRSTVGVRFLDLSQRKREQLTMLVEEIGQMHAQKDTPGEES